MLREEGVLSTRALTEALQVSHMTVRRDIAALQATGLAVPVQGGVRLAGRAPKEPPSQRSVRIHLETSSKQAIARAASGHVSDEMTVFLDAGTTCEAVVPHLAGFSGLTVITSDFNTALALASHEAIDVIHTGGVLDRDRSSATGPLAAATVSRLVIDLYLASTGSWDAALGITVPVADTALLKRAILDSSAVSVLLADSTKFGSLERYRVCELEELSLVITDDRLPKANREEITRRGVVLEIVNPDS